jgi:hypothetical protein
VTQTEEVTNWRQHTRIRLVVPIHLDDHLPDVNIIKSAL